MQQKRFIREHEVIESEKKKYRKIKHTVSPLFEKHRYSSVLSLSGIFHQVYGIVKVFVILL